MDAPTFIPAPPFFRRFFHPVIRSPRTLQRANLSHDFNAPSESIARLLSLQKAILTRRDKLKGSPAVEKSGILSKSSEKPRHQSSAVQHSSKSFSTNSPQSGLQTAKTNCGENNENIEHSDKKLVDDINNARPNIAHNQNSYLRTSDFSGDTNPNNQSTKEIRDPVVILRYAVNLPWKSRNEVITGVPPTKVELPHLTIFTEGSSVQSPSASVQSYTNSQASSVTQLTESVESLSSAEDHAEDLNISESALSIGNVAVNSKNSVKSFSAGGEFIGDGVKSSVFIPSQKESADDNGAENVLSGLNEHQREAVIADSSRACLVLAGPGSGKTRVLTHRIAYLIKARQVPPSAILAVTFTNKAAAEMKERVNILLRSDTENTMDAGNNSLPVTVGTFHWISARLLRRYGEHAGISTDFDICDAQDSRNVVTRVLTKVNDGQTPDSAYISMVVALISKLKNDKEDELRVRMPRFINKLIELRSLYNEQLRSMNMLDFDDLLVETRRMLQECPNTLAHLQTRFQHILVDEWQDTNNVQFDIVSLLSSRNRNLFVVGDVDQSIYKFRGADSGNVQRYTQNFDGAKQVILSLNYRSSPNIVNAAQAVIEQDLNRPQKEMTAINGFGEKVRLVSVSDGRSEAQFVIESILDLRRKGQISSLSDCAVIYRTNSQSRLLEEACVQGRVSYVLQSGTRFFERKEVKDVLAYLKIINNPSDNNAVLRIINVPPRGIGKRTVERIEEYAGREEKMLLAAIEDMTSVADIESSLNLRSTELQKLRQFYDLVQKLRNLSMEFRNQSESEGQNIGDLVLALAEATGYMDFIKSNKDGENDDKIQDRLDNLAELIRGASLFQDVSAFLEQAVLMSGTNTNEDRSNTGAIWLATLHGSKGLEFDAVFITGAEDGIIPLIRDGKVEDEEEERRLLYVGMTRAKRHLTVTWRAERSKRSFVRDRYGKIPSRLSRFLQKIPEHVICKKTDKRHDAPIPKQQNRRFKNKYA